MHAADPVGMSHMEFSTVTDESCCHALRESTHFSRGRFRTLLSCLKRLLVLKNRSTPKARQEDCSGTQRLMMEVSQGRADEFIESLSVVGVLVCIRRGIPWLTNVEEGRAI